MELRERAQTEGTEPRPEESRDWLSSHAHAEMIVIISFVYCPTFLNFERINNKAYIYLKIQESAAIC